MESDNEREENLEERDAGPVCIRILGGRDRDGPPAAVSAAIDTSMWFSSMVNVKALHSVDLGIESII